jgi:transposase-like protein
MSSVSRSNSKISPSIKSKVLQDILAPNCKFRAIAKKYNLSTTTLYSWRQDYFKNIKHKPLVSNNFVELISSPPKDTDSKLSKISLSINNISLSLSGSIVSVR